jgi:hypothetical protein
MMPGIGFRYSGGGFLVAQQMVEDLTRRPFAQFVRDTVLRPIGMTSSVYEQPLSSARASRSAVEYDARGAEIAGGALIYPQLAPAGLWTTDLSRWDTRAQVPLAHRLPRVTACRRRRWHGHPEVYCRCIDEGVCLVVKFSQGVVSLVLTWKAGFARDYSSQRRPLVSNIVSSSTIRPSLNRKNVMSSK